MWASLKFGVAAWVLLSIWIGVASTTLAASVVVPSGWRQGDAVTAEARDRAERWARAWQGEVVALASTAADDSLSETLALIEVAAPLPAELLTDTEAATPWMLARMQEAFGGSATVPTESIELRHTAKRGVAIVVGRGNVEGQLGLVAFAPRGAHYLALVLWIDAEDEILYGTVFEDALGGLGDLQAPIAPFPVASTILVAWLLWLGLGLGLGGWWVHRGRATPGPRVAGRQAAVVIALVAVVLLTAVGMSLGNAQAELALADSTPWGLAMYTSVGGVAVTLVLLLVGEGLERSQRTVASAPTQGTFAHRSTADLTPTASPSPAPETAPLASPAATPTDEADERVRPQISGIADALLDDEHPAPQTPLVILADEDPATLVDARDDLVGRGSDEEPS